MNAACKLFVLLACVVSFQITKPGNVEPSKNFVGIWDHGNIFTRKFKTQKFLDLRYIVPSYTEKCHKFVAGGIVTSAQHE